MSAARCGPAFAGSLMLLLASHGASAAEQVSRERDIVDLRLGQRVQVDDGACPQGQIKEVSGAQLSSSGGDARRPLRAASRIETLTLRARIMR